jgi:hypothetical protein
VTCNSSHTSSILVTACTYPVLSSPVTTTQQVTPRAHQAKRPRLRPAPHALGHLDERRPRRYLCCHFIIATSPRSMTQSSAGEGPDSATDMDQDMVIDPDSRLLVTQTRDLTLVSPGVPVSASDIAAAHWFSLLPSPDSPATSSSWPAAPSRHADSGNATPLGDKLHGSADAQPSPLACPYTCATSSAEDKSHGTSCQSQPGIGTVKPDLEEGGAVGISSSQGHGQGHITQAIADQPAITFPTLSCHPHANATPPASRKHAPSATSEPEGETTAAQDGVVMKRPAVAGKAMCGNCLNWAAARLNFDGLPNEVLMHILSFLEVCDLLSTSRVCWLVSFCLLSYVSRRSHFCY